MRDVKKYETIKQLFCQIDVSITVEGCDFDIFNKAYFVKYT